MSREIKRLKRELKYEGKIITVYSDQIRFPDGKTAQWDYIHHVGAAAVVPVLPNGNILMVKQFRNAVDRYTLEIPAGALDSAEEPGRVCAARELEEETGYRAERLEWLITLRTTIAFCNERIEVYVATDLKTTQQNLDEDEYVEVASYPLEDLLNKIFSGEIEDSKTVSALLAYKTKCS